MKHLYKRIWVMLIVLICVTGLIACSLQQTPQQTPSAQEHKSLTVAVLKIGQADAILLHNDAGTMLIDTGEDEDGEEIEEFEPVEQELMEQLIEVVKTNFDSDGDILDELSDE